MSLDHALNEQPDLAIRNTYFQRCLGIQASLGFPGDSSLRPIEAVVAFVMLNLRYFCLALAFTFNKKPNGSENELRKPGMSSVHPSNAE